MNIFKKNNRPFLLLIIIFIVFVTLEYLSPKEIDWTPSFSKEHKKPFGTFVLRENMQDIFVKHTIFENSKTLYEFSQDKPAQKLNYLFITDQFKMDKYDLDFLMAEVDSGAEVFISAIDFPKQFEDTLKFKVSPQLLNTGFDSSVINLYNKSLRSEKDYKYTDKAMYPYSFSSIDTSKCIVLGYYEKFYPNFIKYQFGKGAFYLHTQPMAFTNYNILNKNNSEYVSKALSYLTNKDLIWDEYYKPNKMIETTPLLYILKHPALKMAYIVTIIGVLLFMFFESKRKQRIIPVIKAPSNTSLEFVETISRLYLHSGNHKDLALKKFSYLLEFLRSNYYLHINMTETIHIEKISEKTSVPFEICQKLFNKYHYIQACDGIFDYQLLEFNNLIEDFYKTCR